MAESSGDAAAASNPFTRVPIGITVSVGRAHPMVRDLLALENEAVLVLDKRVEDPVELFVGDKLIARGELQELDGRPVRRQPGRIDGLSCGSCRDANPFRPIRPSQCKAGRGTNLGRGPSVPTDR